MTSDQIEQLKLVLTRLANDKELREVLDAQGPTVLATRGATPALILDWTWLLDQLPTLIPLIVSVFSGGGLSAPLIVAIVQILAKVFASSQDSTGEVPA